MFVVSLARPKMFIAALRKKRAASRPFGHRGPFYIIERRVAAKSVAACFVLKNLGLFRGKGPTVFWGVLH